MDEEVSKEYKSMFNFAYSDMKHNEGKAVKDLFDLYESQPSYKDTEAFQALKAGREQAEKDLERDMNNMYRDDLLNSQQRTKEDITHQPDKPTPDPPKGLSPEQIKELQDNEFREATSRIKQAANEAEREQQRKGKGRSR